jgi:hypothetical protein
LPIGKWFIGYLTPNQCSGLNYSAKNRVKFKMSYDVEKERQLDRQPKNYFGAVTFVPLENVLLAI